MSKSTWRRKASIATSAAMTFAATSAIAVSFASGASADAGAAKILGTDNPTAIAGEYIVTFKDQGATMSASARESAQSRAAAKTKVNAAAAALATKHGGKVERTYSNALSGYSAKMSQAQAKAVANDPSVASVEQAFEVSVLDTQTNPPSWGLDRIDQASLPLSSSYTYASTAGAGVHAYILDTGINPTHSDFTGRVGNGYDAVSRDTTPTDCHGHGSHVAGTAVGTRYGVAKKATLHGVRVLDCSGSGSNAVIIAGFDWVRANAAKPAVVNYSIGCRTRCSSTALDSAVSNTIASGITVAMAGGNGNDDACYYSPQKVAAGLTVGNSTINDAKASTSAWGPCQDLFAPGTSITSAWYTSSTATATISGTSMASPHVAGAAALYLGANPSATPAQVHSALVGNATTGKITGLTSATPNRLLNVSFIR